MHVAAVSSLPEAFTMHEFRLVCQMMGLPVDDAKQRQHKQYEVQRVPSTGLQLSFKSQQQINDFCDQLYTTYVQLYETFKSQHKTALRQTHVSPSKYTRQVQDNKETTRNPFDAPVLKNYSRENQ